MSNYTDDDMLKWIKSNQFSEVPLLEAHNFKSYVTLNDKMTAIMCVDTSITKSVGQSKNFFNKMLKQPLPTVHSKIKFALMDGIAYKDFLQQFNVDNTKLPKLIILDTNVYY